jgi:hypothetical protein
MASYVDQLQYKTWPTAKNQYQKFETNIPRKGIARPQSQFPHSCVCERFTILQQEICRPILGIYKSLTDTSMWKLGLRPAQFPEKEFEHTSIRPWSGVKALVKVCLWPSVLSKLLCNTGGGRDCRVMTIGHVFFQAPHQSRSRSQLFLYLMITTPHWGGRGGDVQQIHS